MPEDLLAGLFPAPVQCAWEEPRDDLEGLHPAECERVSQSVAKRRAEFAAGRRCARRLLGNPDFALLNDGDRVPVWPRDWVGSISHTAGLCVVAVAPADFACSIGIDIEQRASVRPELWRMVCTPAERARLEALDPERGLRDASALFSAKEAVYKCLFPLERVVFGFHDVEVELEATGRAFTAQRRPLEDHPARAIEGTLSRNGRWIFTGVLLRVDGP